MSDRIEARIGQRQLVHVAEPHVAVTEPGALEIDARDREHLARLVVPTRARRMGPEDLQHPTGASADIEQIVRLAAAII
jgi:hypothetical protein